MMLVGCQGDPYSGTYTRTRPNETDLIGRWVPDAATLAYMRTGGGYDTSRMHTRIVLRSDGTFELFDMPDWWRDGFGRSHGSFESSSGKWNVGQHPDDKSWEIELAFRAWNTSMSLRGQKPPYLIHVTLGDPDQNDAMVFVKAD